MLVLKKLFTFLKCAVILLSTDGTTEKAKKMKYWRIDVNRNSDKLVTFITLGHSLLCLQMSSFLNILKDALAFNLN